jgi:hypothetical protein
LQGPLTSLFLGDILVTANRFDDLLADGVHGVECGHRLLEDHRNPLAAQGP